MEIHVRGVRCYISGVLFLKGAYVTFAKLLHIYRLVVQC